MKGVVLATLCVVFTGLAIFSSCFAPSAKEKGKMLADKYCSSCHLPVDPSMLDKETWTKHVLPAMAPKLGIRVWSGDQYYPVEGQRQEGQISFQEWVELVKYYEQQAPEKLSPAKPPVPLQHDWFGFSIKRPVGVDSPGVATTTMVSFDTTAARIFTSDGYKSTLSAWDSSLRKVNSWQLPSAVVDMLYTRDSGKSSPAIITQIGNMRAVDEPAGIISRLNINDPASKKTDLMPFLKRPVQTLQADFDKDNLVDLLVCAFGHNQGGLYWLKQLPDHRYEQKTITEVPGAIHAEVGDFNGDGWPDAMVLFAAADEGIWLYENDRHGGFKSINLLRFPPLNGSTGFQLVDFNQDGKPDILYTCGDNADFSMVLKPFHGLYVYMNEGNNSYRQAWFYPVNGCTKAVAADFNLDGKTDIAAIAFFADLKNNPAEKFILFEGKDHQLNFTPHAPPIEKEGRWICMDIRDMDGDGDQDIILGNYGKGFNILDGYTPDWKEYQPFIVLENKRK